MYVTHLKSAGRGPKSPLWVYPQSLTARRARKKKLRLDHLPERFHIFNSNNLLLLELFTWKKY